MATDTARPTTRRRRVRPADVCNTAGCHTPIDGEYRAGSAFTYQTRVCQDCARRIMTERMFIWLLVSMSPQPPTVGSERLVAAAPSPQDASGPTAVAPAPEPRPQEGR